MEITLQAFEDVSLSIILWTISDTNLKQMQSFLVIDDIRVISTIFQIVLT